MANRVKCLKKNSLILVIGFILCGCYALTAQVSNPEKQDYLFNHTSSDSPMRLMTETNNHGFHLDAIKHNQSSKSVKALSIKIVESQSFNVLHDMDQTWLTVCQNMGHNATLEQQTLLDNADFFSTTDILIVSSGVVEMPNNRRDIIQQYVEQGGPVYFQSEYDKNLTTNQAFETIVNNLGGVFSWGFTITGELSPMNVMGVLSAIPNAVPTLSYFWYGSIGTADNTFEPFLEFAENQYGFIFTPPNTNFGSMISISDQDWAIQSNEKMLMMENIITYLSSTLTGIEEPGSFAFDFLQNSPNPFNSSTTITFNLDHPGKVKIMVYNLLGNVIQILTDDIMQAGNFTENFSGDHIPEGIYCCTLQLDNQIVATIKMHHIK
jgi:hypothetical protein